jgi:hypothetical protein
MPREGFTIDLVGRLLRRSIFNPIISTPLALGVYWRPLSFPDSNSSRILEQAAYIFAACSLLLSANDILNQQFHNNWTSNVGWNWGKEIVLITGGSSGIGATLARELYARNPRTRIVIIDYVPLTWQPEKGSRISYYRCDLSNSSSIQATCSRIRQEVGQPTVLVNNAGICRGLTVCDGAYGDVEATVRTNLIAPFLLVKEFLPWMAQHDHGHIINISSMSALLPPSKVADYAATKAGLIALHEVCGFLLAMEEK